MRAVSLVCLAFVTLCSAADNKKKVTNEAGNEKINIYAEPLMDPAEIKAAVGAELPPGIIAIRMKIVPRSEEPININRDDFQLISHKDGQRSLPFSPSQIAGNSTLVVSTKYEAVGMGRRSNGPVIGGAPTGTGGRPAQLPSANDQGMGNMRGVETAEAKVDNTNNKQRENPLVALLDEKMMPDKETNDAVTGLLYFPLDGKHKLKDLELIYKGPAGKLFLPFQ